MVWKLKCECEKRYETKINSLSLFNEIEAFFECETEKGIYKDVPVSLPHYIWTDEKDTKEWYATKWYKCNICDCLWEFDYPDFPAKGFVRKFPNGIYRREDQQNERQ